MWSINNLFMFGLRDLCLPLSPWQDWGLREGVPLYSPVLLGVIWVSGNAEKAQKTVNTLKNKRKRRAQCSGGSREWIHPLVALFTAGISDKSFICSHYLCKLTQFFHLDCAYKFPIH